MALEANDLDAIRSIVREEVQDVKFELSQETQKNRQIITDGFSHQSKTLHALQNAFVDREEFDQLKSEVEELKDLIASLGPPSH